jgi:GxxExxY protein
MNSNLERVATVVVDSALAVHRALGPGFLESVYEEALTIELEGRSIPFERQVPFAVEYRGRSVGQGRIDLLVDGQLIVELKAVDSFAPIHVAQLISYLRAFRRQLGFLINFNVPLLRTGLRRVVVSGTA